jgi:tetratricopeptide (TPR) repeat protein
MACPDVDTITALFEGALTAADASRVATHADGCDGCRSMLAELAQMASGIEETAPHTEISIDPPRAPSAGERIGRYVALKVLGSGSMGVVVAAHDPDVDRKVAIKLLRQGSERLRDQAQARLLREAQAIGRVSHPNVIAVYDVGVHQDGVYVAMELVDGGTLAEWLAGEARSTHEILRVFREAGQGLAAAHSAGIVHRDFKPDNVLMANDGRVKVADFGLARATASPPHSSAEAAFTQLRVPLATTQTGSVMGTPAYMAPEQRRGEADAKSDQFSFCVAAYEGLFGERPSALESGQRPAARARARRLRPRVPSRALEAILRGLDIDPVRRHESMVALVQALGPTTWLGPRTVVLGAVAIALAGVGTAAAAVHARRPPLCSGAERQLAGAWDATREREVREAFTRSGQPYAAFAAQRVTTILDAYASRWTAEYTGACQATRVRAEQSEAILDLRMRCLDRQRAQLERLSGILSTADAKVIERAVPAAYELPSVADCSISRVSELDPPADAALEADVAQSATLARFARYNEAERAASADLSRARAEHAPLLESESLTTLATVASERDDVDRALSLDFDALTAAQRAGADGRSVAVLVQLVTDLGRDRADEAERWLRLADAILERSGGEAALHVDVGIARGNVNLRAGKLREAVTQYRSALEGGDGAAGSPIHRAMALNNMGVALADLDDQEGAEDAEAKAEAIWERELGPDHPRIALVLNNRAIAALNRGSYEAARAFAERSLAISTEQQSATAQAAIAASTLGHALACLGRYDESRGALLKALALADSDAGIPRKRLARIHMNLGQLDRLERKYDDAISAYEQALQLIREAVGEGDPSSTDALVGLGRVYLEQGLTDNALPLLEQGLAIREKQTTPPELAEARLALAQALMRSGHDRERAKALALQGRNYFGEHPSRQGEVRELLAALRPRQP